jgi:hypothetical protein
MDRLGLCRLSRSQIIQKFFGSFFQKRTERKRFFFEKEAKNFRSYRESWWRCALPEHPNQPRRREGREGTRRWRMDRLGLVSHKPKPNHSKVFWFFFSKKNRKKALLF